MPPEDEDAVQATPVEARQGFLNRDVLIVLVASTALAAIALLTFFAVSAQDAAAVSFGAL